MRHKQTYKPLQMAFCAALLSAAFASCSNSESDSLSASEDVKVPLSISATIQPGTQARKASYDATVFSTGDEIGLYILSTDDMASVYNDGYTCYNIRATYDGSSWALDNDVYLYEDNAYVIAYYPYNESFGSASLPSSDSPITIDITPTDNEQADVLTSASVTASRESPTASLTFDHVLTRVILSVGLSGDIETASLTSATISGSNLYAEAGLYLSGGSFTAGSTSSTADEMALTLDTTLDTSARQDIDFLITSQSSAALTATLVIDGTSYTVDLTTDSWEAGCQYTYLINVIRTEGTEDIYLEVESSSYINGWSDQGTADEIDITYEKNSSSQIEYEAVDLGLSVKWATFNVGAESPEDYGNYYAWGETVTKDEYTSDNSVTYEVSDISDFAGDAEYDAATANWGDTWRMPTVDEADELMESSCTWTWTTLNDVEGYLVTADNGNSIFLPATGYIDGTTLYEAGSHGFCWTSSPHDSYTIDGYSFNYYDGFHSIWSPNGEWYYRYYGFTVRPVTE